MRTLLSHFCEEFGEVVRPLLTPLESSTDSLSSSPPTVPVHKLLPGLRESRHQLRALADKVEEQQAYVLIFGPLKSGKSTLMNAVATSYVSEVTTLPAYPCMVFVAHAEKREYVLTQYNGQQETLHDPAALRMHINRAHNDLAERIREIEQTGADFEPSVHYPEAIRRLDVRVPAPHLGASGTVLVDTPGLYTRMKFGYDRMTREFRDSAACAVFVVKTDNLFLEQVFNEFNQLLELFSRIFLVVNLDTTKKDLRPDGSLVPSLESEDPLRIIEAFENLSMSSPIKTAAEEGRLKIYPADLMNAASRRLRDGIDGPGSSAETPDSAAPGNQADFEGFLGDLTEYLNSSDYLAAFLGDSLRHARNLVEQIGVHLHDDSVQDLQQHVAELEQRRDAAQARQSRLEQLLTHPWADAFGGLDHRLEDAASSSETDLPDCTVRSLAGEVAQWFEQDSSLKTLEEDAIPGVLRTCQQELISSMMAGLRRSNHQQAPGVPVPDAILAQAAASGIDLKALAKAAVDEIDASQAIEHATLPLHKRPTPVRKGFWDWVMFRGQDKVRERMFGPKGSNKLNRVAKQKRLGEAGRRFMQGETTDFVHDFFPRTSERLAQWIAQSYAHHLVKGVLGAIESAAATSRSELSSVQSELEQVADLSRSVEQLEQAVTTTSAQLEELTQRYGDTNPSMLELPVENDIEVLEFETLPEETQEA